MNSAGSRRSPAGRLGFDSGVLKPAGADAATGIITAANSKSAGDPTWENDPGMKEYFDWAQKWAPELNPHDSFVAAGYSMVTFWRISCAEAGNDVDAR